MAKQGSELRMASHRRNMMHYVYLLRSESVPEQRYIGLTDDCKRPVEDPLPEEVLVDNVGIGGESGCFL